MRNARLDEAQADSKIARRNINNLRYADDITLMAEYEEDLNNLLMKVKEESEKAGLKLNIQKTKIMGSGPITSWEIDGEWWKQWQILFLGLQNQIEVSFVIYFRKIDLLYDVERYYGGSSYVLLHSDSQSPLEGRQKSNGVSTKFLSEHLNYWENWIGSCV